MDKIKGWRAEYRIDKSIKIMKENIFEDAKNFHWWKEALQINTALRQAKTL